MSSEVIEELQNDCDYLEAKVLRLENALSHYYDTQCEGWCTDNGGTFQDCGGCLAREALEQSILEG